MLSVFGLPSASSPPTSPSVADMVFDFAGQAIFGQQPANRPVLAFRAGAVIAPDVEDQSVVAHAKPVQLAEQTPCPGAGMLHEAREDLHEPPLERPLGIRNAIPPSPGFRP